jgi:pimeloyl-ACP methyl ester carboxylesterase
MGGFRQGSVEANGRRLRYADAGHGVPLVHLQPPGDPRPTPAHDLLARRFRVVLVESSSVGEVDAGAVAAALTTLGVETFNLIGSAAAAEVALRLAQQARGRVLAVVLETPAANRQADDPTAWLSSLVTPTLVLIGTRAGATSWRRSFVERIPGCHLVFVYDAGSPIDAERPEAFAEVVTDFFDRHEAFVVSRAGTVIHP